MSSPDVIVVGGGLAGLATSVALADRGFRIRLLERHPRLGGRATSYVLPDGEDVDNCQHVTLRCCTNLEEFYRTVGVAEKIRYFDRLVFADSSGHRAAITASRLPPPLHLVPSFATFGLLDWRDKRAIARAMLRIVRTGGQPKLPEGITMLEWLKQQGQTLKAIDRFWRVVLVSALNEDLDHTKAAYGIAVFWKAFLSNPRGFGVGIPTVPLAQLYSAGEERIERTQGEVHTRCGVAELVLSGGRIAGVRADDGREMAANYYVLATTFDRLLRILPENLRNNEPFSELRNLKVSPITSLHFWFDRVVMSEPFITSLDQTIQWVFNKTEMYGSDATGPGQYLQIVISASHALSRRSKEEIIDVSRKDLAQLLPETARAKLTRCVVVREAAATFSPRPDCDRWRLPQRTSIPNLLLAGDWTQTGWPACMEGAVRSGYQAAEAILTLEGRPAQLVRPELPVTGLAKWWSARARSGIGKR
jgi:squalene-associated FAD-dependent desaturase